MVNQHLVLLLISVLLIAEETLQERVCRFMSPDLDGLIRLQERSLWNALTGYFCYFYVNPKHLKYFYRPTLVAINGWTINVTMITNSTYFLYDYKNATALYYIKRAFKEELFFEKWRTCAREAESCCDNFMTADNIYPNDEYPCPAVWDSWTCFAPAVANSVSREVCPEVTFSSQYRSCELTSEKKCLSVGVWANSTDYEICSLAPVLLNRLNFHVIILAVTAAASFPAVVIFFSFYKFRHKLTFVLHRNLILALIIRSLLTIITKEIILKDALERPDEHDTVMKGNSVECRVLTFFENVSKNGIFACMLVDGFYLHQIIVRPFANQPNVFLLHVVVFILSVLPSLIWALLRGLHGATDCWMVDTSGDQWVSDGFRYFILGVNTLLLADIIRVLIMKLRGDGIPRQARTTLRMTLFLIPLFGIHIMVMSNRNMVPDNTCRSQDIYYYFSYSIEGLQVLAVATLFCYLNGEVYLELKNAVRKATIYISSTSKDNNNRRPTTETIVGSILED